MDFFNDISKQFRDLFSSMSPGARVTAGLLLAVVVVSLGYLFQQSTAGPDGYLFGAEPLSGRQINAMTAAMSQAGLNGFEVEGARIKAPRGKRHEYIAAIADAGALPSDAKDFMAKALDGGSWLEPRETKQQRIKLALQQELSHVIGWFPWVERASVVYDLKQVRGPRAREKASATVSILPGPGEMLDSRRARNIKNLVAGGFTSMKPEDVVVNNMGGDESYGAFAGDTDAGEFETPYHRERARVENEVRKEILGHLSYIPGVSVQVSAILDDLVQEQSSANKPDPTSVPESEVTEDQETVETVNDPAGRPGQVVNSARGPSSAEAPERTTERRTTSTKAVVGNRVGHSTTSSVRVGMAAKEIQASVQVPRNFVVDVWKDQQMQLTGAVPEKIDPASLTQVEDDVKRQVELAVKPLLPKLAQESDYDQVNVVVIDTIKPEPLPEPSMASGILAWGTQNSSTIAMLGVAVFSLLMLRSMVRASPSDDTSSPALELDVGDASAGAESEDEAGGEEDGSARPKLKLRKAESLKDDLSEIVRDDPDAAAAILRNWIGNAG